jgi:hypothetical protein
MQTLATANAQQQMPMQNYAQLAGILGPLAGMFGQQSGTANTQGTQTKSGFDQATGWMNAFANMGKAFA